MILTIFDGLTVNMSITELWIQYLKKDKGTVYHQTPSKPLFYGIGVKSENSIIEAELEIVFNAILTIVSLCVMLNYSYICCH